MTDQAGLAERVGLLEVRCAISELTARYNAAWDDGRVDEWIDTFTGDGEFVMKGVPQTKGPDSLRAMIESMIPVGFVHLTVDHQIDVRGDEAHQTARVILGRREPGRKPGSSSWVTSGSYSDDLRLTAGGWRFARRTFAPDASLSGLPKWW